jgi:hypothetical protein
MIQAMCSLQTDGSTGKASILISSTFEMSICRREGADCTTSSTRHTCREKSSLGDHTHSASNTTPFHCIPLIC